jgi:hypothetical protein
MRRSVAGVDLVLAVARDALRSDGLSAEHHPVGFGNENWRLRDTDGSCYVLKIGDSGNGAKWRSSHVALELARAAGLRVPQLVHLGELDGRLVRIFTWIDGETATNIRPGTDKSERLLRTTGAAVRALHTIGRDLFSSRLDGSAPTFPTWRAYVDHRLWDAAEAWDRAGDWFKLEFDLLAAHPDGSSISSSR